MATKAPRARTISVDSTTWNFWVREARKAGLSVSAFLRKIVNDQAAARKKEAA